MPLFLIEHYIHVVVFCMMIKVQIQSTLQKDHNSLVNTKENDGD
jgi:hypothetical protein